jgi:FAD/FMN-containing dehydrogenase
MVTVDSGPGTYAAYAATAGRLREAMADVPPGTPVRLGKRTSNLFRPRGPAPGAVLDVDGLSGVLGVDRETRTADVLGMTTYEDLVDATLPYGLMPAVVPQLRTITLGGAVTGLGIESSSFREGLPHETVLEMDVLTGDGRLVTARPEGEHRDLFLGFPNSYGTLGYALRLRIELRPVQPYVGLRHVPFADLDAFARAMAEACDHRAYDGADVDFVDGTVFSPREAYLTLGTWAAAAAQTPSDYTGQRVYYRSIRERRTDVLTTLDYLWRWDTDWFWCSQAFGAQHPLVRRLWPRRLLRSDTYWRLVRLDERTGVSGRVDRLRRRPAREKVVQDIEVPVERTAEFLRWFDAEVGMRPVWACPLRQRDPSLTWSLYAFDPEQLYVNLGFWGTVALPAGQGDGFHNRRVEREVARLRGRKSLYSTAFYDEAEFRALYGGDSYARLKTRYDPQGRLLDLYDKCVRRA